ncbi:hypothetical protein [Hydrogenimonas sp.]
MRLFLITLFFGFLLAGCSTETAKNGGFDEPAKEPPRTKYRTFVSDEELANRKELAQIEAQKAIELEKIGSSARLKELELQKERELALMQEREKMLALEHEQAMERYTLLGAILLLLLAGAALLWYFDRRRKDKLRAYEDNLKKYFHQKENEARLKIAEKILDTVASRDLNDTQRAKLIEALHGPVAGAGTAAKEEEAKRREEEESPEAILIEPKENATDATGTKT